MREYVLKFKSGKFTFQPLSFVQFEYSTHKLDDVEASAYIGEAVSRLFIWNSKCICEIGIETSCKRQLRLNEKKVQDLGWLMCFMPFYEEIWLLLFAYQVEDVA